MQAPRGQTSCREICRKYRPWLNSWRMFPCAILCLNLKNMYQTNATFLEDGFLRRLIPPKSCPIIEFSPDCPEMIANPSATTGPYYMKSSKVIWQLPWLFTLSAIFTDGVITSLLLRAPVSHYMYDCKLRFKLHLRRTRCSKWLCVDFDLSYRPNCQLC